MPRKPNDEKPSDEAQPKLKKKKGEETDNGPNSEVMVKTGFGPARKITLKGGFAYQWFDSKREVVRVDFAAEDKNGGWATVSFGPLGGAEQQLTMLLDLIKKNESKLLSVAKSTDSHTVTEKERLNKDLPKTETKLSKAKKPKDDLEDLFDNPLLRKRKGSK